MKLSENEIKSAHKPSTTACLWPVGLSKGAEKGSSKRGCSSYPVSGRSPVLFGNVHAPGLKTPKLQA